MNCPEPSNIKLHDSTSLLYYVKDKKGFPLCHVISVMEPQNCSYYMPVGSQWWKKNVSTV